MRFLRGGHQLDTPFLIVENGAPDACIATVAAGERKVGEQLGNALVENGAIVATSLLAERCLAHACCPTHEQVLMRIIQAPR